MIHLARSVEKKVLEALTELLGQFQKGRRLILQMKKEVRQDAEGACWGSPPTLLPAFPPKLREPNLHTAGGWFPGQFALTLQDKKHKRVPTGQAVTAVPFNRVYDFPGASQPGDATASQKKKILR